MPGKCGVKDAFIWSASVAYLCLILLLCSVSQAGVASLMSVTARNRTAADRLQFLAYNLLLDLNLCLYQRIGEEAYRIAALGGDPQLLNRVTLQDWLSTIKNRLAQEGVEAEATIPYFKLSRHTTSSRDVVLMTALGLPLSHPSYIGAIDIDADLNVSLRDVHTDVAFQTFFKLKAFNPVRIFWLSEIAVNFRRELQIIGPSWTSKTRLNEIAGMVEARFVEFAESFLQSYSSQACSIDLSYVIHVMKINATQCQLRIVLNDLEITDMGNYASVVIDSQLTRVVYKSLDKKVQWNYLGQFNIEDSNEAILAGRMNVS
jgi:hypothetical protein